MSSSEIHDSGSEFSPGEFSSELLSESDSPSDELDDIIESLKLRTSSKKLQPKRSRNQKRKLKRNGKDKSKEKSREKVRKRLCSESVQAPLSSPRENEDGDEDTPTPMATVGNTPTSSNIEKARKRLCSESVQAPLSSPRDTPTPMATVGNTPTSSNITDTPRRQSVTVNASPTPRQQQDDLGMTPTSFWGTMLQDDSRMDVRVESPEVHNSDVRYLKRKVQILETKMEVIVKQNKEMLQKMNEVVVSVSVSKEKGNKSIRIPSQIKTAVRDGYRCGKDEKSLKWTAKDQDGKALKCNSSDNKEMTEHIVAFVKGLYSETEVGIINASIRRYFESFKQKEHKKTTGKAEKHRRTMILYSRKKRKLQWRKAALQQKKSYDIEKKKRIEKALKIDYMSSEEEGETDDENVFVVKPLPCRSVEFEEILVELDRKNEQTR